LFGHLRYEAKRRGLTINGRSAGRLAKQGNSRRITAKRGNVIPNPLKGKPLIKQAQILCAVGVAREAKEAHPVAAAGRQQSIQLNP
jgi:hypothetical protein